MKNRAKSRYIALFSYHEKELKELRVSRLVCEPQGNPIDFNINLLFEKYGWGLSDRLRFWYAQELKEMEDPLLSVLLNPNPHILLRKLDIEEGVYCHCMISLDGNLEILSNNEEYSLNFFNDIFLDVPPAYYQKRRDWKIKKYWSRDKALISMYTGSLTGALGWYSDRVPTDIKDSLDEGIKNIELKNWKSCVVMCRRSIESLMRLAYRRFFKKDPLNSKGRDLSLNEIVREFQHKKPYVFPIHLINIIDSIRNLGNIPGAHPKGIKGYKFTKSDAIFAIENARFIVGMYFNKIDKELGTVYTLKIDLSDNVKEKE